MCNVSVDCLLFVLLCGSIVHVAVHLYYVDIVHVGIVIQLFLYRYLHTLRTERKFRLGVHRREEEAAM